MISLIVGTNRAGALSRRLALLLQEQYAAADVETQVLDLGEMPPEALAPTAYKEKPAAVVEKFVEPVLASDGLHVVVPEYNGSFPGVLKLFVDLLPFPEAFERRPTAYTGIAAGDNGALRAVEQLQLVFGYRNAFNYPERVFLSAAYKAWNEDGSFADDALLDRLRRQCVGFAAFVEALASVRQRPE
jgi:chromate reductase